MIFTNSLYQGAHTVINGSFVVHLALLIALWICVEPIAADETQYIDGLTRPRDLMVAISAVHVLVALSQILNLFVHCGEIVEEVQGLVTTVTLWVYIFAVLVLCSDYLNLVNEREFEYLFERPLIWQSYATWMLLEILLFSSSVMSTVIYLTCRSFCRNKLSVDVKRSSFYKQWAGQKIAEEIRKEKNINIDHTTSGKTALTLIFTGAFTAPLLAYLAIQRTKYFQVLTEEQQSVFKTEVLLLGVQTFGALFLTFNPFMGRQNCLAKVISAWMSRLCFGLTFFAVPGAALTLNLFARQDQVFEKCHLNVLFLSYFVLNCFHIIFGLYATAQAIGKVEEVAIQIQMPSPQKSQRQQPLPPVAAPVQSAFQQPSMTDNSSSCPGEPRRAWQTLDDKSQMSQTESQIHTSQITQNDVENRVQELERKSMADFRGQESQADDKNSGAFKYRQKADQHFEGGENEQQASSYFEVVREPGSGPVRIGSQLNLGRDLYSMLFASCFQHDLVHYYDRVRSGRDKSQEPQAAFSQNRADPFAVETEEEKGQSQFDLGPTSSQVEEKTDNVILSDDSQKPAQQHRYITEENEDENEERASLTPPKSRGEADAETKSLLVKRVKHLSEHRLLLSQTLTVWLAQIMVLYYVSEDTYLRVDLEFPQAIPEVKVTFLRFVSGLFMHLLLESKLRAALQKMKFSLNHFWRFHSFAIAFLSGLLQAVVIIGVQLIIFTIVTLSHDLVEVVTHFLALYAIAMLDEALFTVLASGNISKRVIEEKRFCPLKEIAVTTSHNGAIGDNCSLQSDDQLACTWVNVQRKSLLDYYSKELVSDRRLSAAQQRKAGAFVEKIGEPLQPVDNLRVTMSDRIVLNKTLYFVYRAMRFFYVSVWYYGAPFLAIGLQFMIVDTQLERENLTQEQVEREELQKVWWGQSDA